MPRKKHLRKVVSPPKFKSYLPNGYKSHNKEEIDLLYEEYEAINLSDYQGLHHHEACRLMGVSRATFARIYESARKKIAAALVEVREIRAVFGNAAFDENWFICHKCNARFTLALSETNNDQCPICASLNFEPIMNK
ncbi:MAG: DUF134 domain-containing protein [Bacteroidota bacterium]